MNREQALLLITALLDKVGGSIRVTEADCERIGTKNVRIYVDEKTGNVVAHFMSNEEAALHGAQPAGEA